MRKLSILGLICLFIFVFGCKKPLPTSPDIPDILVLPSITYFIATPFEIVVGSPSNLTWSVTNATKVEIDQGIGVVEAQLDNRMVTPTSSTTYTLTATNDDGEKTASVTVTVVLPKTGLTVITIPEIPILIYHPDPNDNDLISHYHSQFTLTVMETDGVGGNVLIYLYVGSRYTGPFFSSQKEFEPLGILSYDIDCYVTKHDIQPPPDPTITVTLEGVDDNGYSFYVQFTIPVILGE